MRLSHRWYTTSGLLYRPDSRLCARADQRESSEMSAQSIPLKDRTDLQLQPWRQFAFELRDAAPNASAPEVPHDARLNIWVILAALLALLLATRYLQHEGYTQRICGDDPSASV